MFVKKKKNVLVTINKRLKIQEPNKIKAIKIYNTIRNKWKSKEENKKYSMKLIFRIGTNKNRR